jgi:hypothetical protein
MSPQQVAAGEHLPVVFYDWLDHLARCQRCRTRAMTPEMVAELLAGTDRDGGHHIEVRGGDA